MSQKIGRDMVILGSLIIISGIVGFIWAAVADDWGLGLFLLIYSAPLSLIGIITLLTGIWLRRK